MTAKTAPRAPRSPLAAAIVADDLTGNAPPAPALVSAKAAAAGKATDKAAGPLLSIPTAAQAAAILDGAAGADDWAAYRDQLAALVRNALQCDRADLPAMSANMSAILAPVMTAAAAGGDWAVRMSKAYGKTEADKRREKAAAKIKTHINSTMQKADASLFMVADWAAGAVMVFTAPTAPESLPFAAKKAGFQAAAYKSARAAAIARLTAGYDADKAAAAKAEAAAFVQGKADKLADATATALPSAPLATTGKDTGPAMDTIAAIRAALADGTADRIATTQWQALAADLAGYLGERSARDAAQAAELAAQAAADKAKKAA